MPLKPTKYERNESTLTFVYEADISDTFMVLRGEFHDVTLQPQPLMLKRLGSLSQNTDLLLHRVDTNFLRRFTLEYVCNYYNFLSRCSYDASRSIT